MRSWRGLMAVVAVAAGLAAGCAVARPAGVGVAEPSRTAVPPVIVGGGLPMEPGEPWLEGPALAASAVSAPLHAVGCAGSAILAGTFYALFFPGDFAEDFKAFVAQQCAGPYLVTPAELARPPLPFPARAVRTPRMGAVPVEEALRRAGAPR